MKTRYIILLPLLCLCTAMAAQEHHNHHHAEDSTDVFFRHLNLNEVTVTGVTGDTKLKHATARLCAALALGRYFKVVVPIAL